MKQIWGSRSALAACVVSVAAGLACGSSSDTPSSPSSVDGGASSGNLPASSGLPCDVDAVLVKSCRSCHGATPSYGAPMPLVTAADLLADAKITKGKKVYEVVGTRIHDDAAPMPQAPAARLGASETAILDRWIAAGAPGASDACSGSDAGSPVGVTPLACTPDQSIRPTSKFAMTDASDLYVCYGFDTNATQKRHVIAGTPRIDNTKIVHHVLLYQAAQTVSGTPAPCGAGGGSGWRLVTGWAPGGKNFELPSEAGFAEEAGTTHWAVQVHYNNTQGLQGQLDGTGYDLCSTDKLRPNDADILATGTLEINLPPRSTTSTTCEVHIPPAYGSIKVISSWAHMHKLGKAEYAKRLRGGVETTLLDAPTYDFNTGAAANSVDVDLTGGDTIRTMCKWTNGTDGAVTFGEATSNEMCFAFLTYYPKITVPKFQWIAPADPLVSKCTSVVQ